MYGHGTLTIRGDRMSILALPGAFLAVLVAGAVQVLLGHVLHSENASRWRSTPSFGSGSCSNARR